MKNTIKSILEGKPITPLEAIRTCKEMSAIGFYPVAVQTSCIEQGSSIAPNGDIFLAWFSQYDYTPAGVHDGLRDGASSACTEKAATYRWQRKHLEKALTLTL